MALSTNASSYALSNYTSSTSSSKSTSSVNASTNALSNYTSSSSSTSSKPTSTSANASSNALSNYTSSTSSSSSAVNKTISAEAWNASATPSSPTPNASSNALSNYTSTTSSSSAPKASLPASSSPTPNASSTALSNYLGRAAGPQQGKQSFNASTNALSNYIESVARIAGSAANENTDVPEQLGPGWSRDENGKLRYESDLLSQILVPGRGPADQVATHVANRDYWQAAVASVAWIAEDLLFVATLGGSQARTAATKLATVGAEKVASTVTTLPKGQVYSVAAEVKLSTGSYPGVSRAAHAQEANEQMLRSMESDPALAQRMSDLGVQINRTTTGAAPRLSPPNWTWHHATEPGAMQLVPREQHTSGSIFQGVLHPNGVGGYALWGRK